MEDRTPCVKGAGVTRVWLYDDGFGAWLDDCVCDWWCVFEEEREGKSEIEDLVFCPSLCAESLFWIGFAICPFSLHVIVGVEHI